MSSILELLIRVLALPAAGYFVVLVIAGLINRMAFDLIAVMCLMALLMLFLASVGLDAAMVLLMIAAHGVTTAGAQTGCRASATPPRSPPNSCGRPVRPPATPHLNAR